MNDDVQLRLLNTFAISVFANQLVIANSENMLFKLWKSARNQGRPVLILGDGSNVLFLENYIGTVLLNRIKGIFITENKISWLLHVGAGEKWSNLVFYTLSKNIPGLENLACIPGRVGAAPIQNIGAYGVELSQICEYVDVLELNNNGKKIRFNCTECHFQYRNSIFNNCLDKYAIVFIGLRLYKRWKPILNHHKLMHLNEYRITSRQLFNIICLVRYKTLPNPTDFGNAGSFFKNPIIDSKVAHSLIKSYPKIPYYRQTNNKIKLSAGWLIENCCLKGYIFGEAAVYYKQALILINSKQIATGTEIAALALFIYNQVMYKFNICLQPEVKFIGRYGAIHPKRLFG